MKTIDQLQEEIKVINGKLNLIDGEETTNEEWIGLESELADLKYELRTLVEYYEAGVELEIYVTSLAEKINTSSFTLPIVKTPEQQIELTRLEHRQAVLKIELDIINIENEMSTLSESVTNEDIEKYVSLSDKLRTLQVLQETHGGIAMASESFVPEDLSEKKVLSTEIDSATNGASSVSLDKPQYLAGFEAISPILTTDKTNTNSDGLELINLSFKRVKTDAELAGLQPICDINTDTKINILEPTSDTVFSSPEATPDTLPESNLEHVSDVLDDGDIEKDLPVFTNRMDSTLTLTGDDSISRDNTFLIHKNGCITGMDSSTFNSGENLYGNNISGDIEVVRDRNNDPLYISLNAPTLTGNGISTPLKIFEVHVNANEGNENDSVLPTSETLLTSSEVDTITTQTGMENVNITLDLSPTVDANETIYKGNGGGDLDVMTHDQGNENEQETINKDIDRDINSSNIDVITNNTNIEVLDKLSNEFKEVSAVYKRGDSDISRDVKKEISEALGIVVDMSKELANVKSNLNGLGESINGLDESVNDLGDTGIVSTLTDSPNRSVTSFINGWAEIIKAEHPFIDPSISRNNIGNGILSDREIVSIDGNEVGSISDVLNHDEVIGMNDSVKVDENVEKLGSTEVTMKQVPGAPADDSNTAAVGPVVDGENVEKVDENVDTRVKETISIDASEVGSLESVLGNGVSMQEVEVGSGAGSTDPIVVGLDVGIDTAGDAVVTAVGVMGSDSSILVVDVVDNANLITEDQIVAMAVANAAPANVPSNLIKDDDGNLLNENAVNAGVEVLVAAKAAGTLEKEIQDNLVKVAVSGVEGNTSATTAADFINNASGNGEVKPAQVIGTGMSTMGTILLQQIEEYQNKMQPRKPVSRNDLSKNQIGLYRVITRILTLDEDFNLVYTKLLEMFHEGRDGVFHETHVFRATEALELPENDRKQFLRLLNLIKFTADVKSRAIALKQIDFGRTLEFIPEIGRQKLLNYYNVN